jgi:peptide/nickel transport system substrate-binding protein
VRARLLLLGAALLLAGCGVNPAGAEGNNTTPQHGGSLKVGLEYEPRTLDPLYAQSQDELQVLRQMFEPLVDVDAALRVSPRLATSWDQSDPLALRFELRRGVLFQNGQPFNAAAAKFTFDRELRAQDSPRRDDLRSVQSVSTDGQYAITLHLRRPDPGLLYRLAGPAGMMLSPAGVTSQGSEYEFARNPVVSGTGPFMFQFWRRGYHLILKRFPRYWGPAPYLDQIDFTQADPAPGLERLRTSDLDVLEQLPRGAIAAASQDPNLRIAWHTGFAYQGIELNQGPGQLFADPSRRRALALAVDRSSLVSRVLAGVDRPAPSPQLTPAPAPSPPPASPAPSPQPASSPSPQPASSPSPGPAVASPAPGVGRGAAFTFTLKVDTESDHLAEAELLRAQLARAGITMLIQPEDPDSLQAELAGHVFQAALVTAGGSPDPGSDLYPEFHTGGAANYGLYSNPQVDAALDAGDYGQARSLVAADGGFVFLDYPPVFDARGAWVRGLRFNSDGTYDLDRTWLA